MASAPGIPLHRRLPSGPPLHPAVILRRSRRICSCLSSHPRSGSSAYDDSHAGTQLLHLHHGQPQPHPVRWRNQRPAQARLPAQRKEHAGFTARYNCDRLVWFERHQSVQNAIAREKELKGWRRSKKIALIESTNPAWIDLSREWYDREPADYLRAQDRMNS